MELYDKVREEAYKLGMSVQGLEDRAGLPRNYLSKWNSSMPSAEKLAKVAQVLNVTMEYLLEIEEPVREIAFQRPELKTLFDLAKDAPTEDIEYVIKKLEKLK